MNNVSFNDVFNYNYHYKDFLLDLNLETFDFVKGFLFKKLLNKSRASVPAAYFIKNRYNGKFYFGSALNVSNRISSHKMNLRNNTHRNKSLQQAYNETCNDLTSFDVCVIFTNTREKAFEIEQFLLDKHFTNPLCCNNAGNAKQSGLGLSPSSEARLKMRNAKLGKKASEETKLKMSIARKNQFFSPERKEKLRLAASKRVYGPLSAEHKEKLSKAGKGRKLSAEHIAILKSGIAVTSRKRVSINGINFNSIKEASSKLNIPCSTLKRKLNDDKNSNFLFM